MPCVQLPVQIQLSLLVWRVTASRLRNTVRASLGYVVCDDLRLCLYVMRRIRADRHMPLSVWVISFVFCVWNGFVQVGAVVTPCFL